MKQYTTISVKIPVEVREEMRRLRIRPSMLLKDAIRRKVKEARIMRLKELRGSMDDIFARFPSDGITASIREDRDLR